MQISSISFLGLIQLIFFLAEIVFFLFLLLKFKAWHIRVLQDRSQIGSNFSNSNFDDFSLNLEQPGMSDFDRERIQDLVENNAQTLQFRKNQTQNSAEKTFLEEQENFLASLVGILGLRKFSASQNSNATSFDLEPKYEEDEDFSEDEAEKVESKIEEDVDFDDFSDEFSDDDFSDFESAESIEEDDFGDFSDIDDYDETRVNEEEKAQENEKAELELQASTEKKQASQIEDDFNDDRLQQTLDDLEEFDFSDFEAELLKD